MKEVEKWKLVNKTKTIEELHDAILEISIKREGWAPIIQGREKSFDAKKMASYVDGVVKGELPPNLLTREYGIRQQAIFLSKLYR